MNFNSEVQSFGDNLTSSISDSKNVLESVHDELRNSPLDLKSLQSTDSVPSGVLPQLELIEGPIRNPGGHAPDVTQSSIPGENVGGRASLQSGVDAGLSQALFPDVSITRSPGTTGTGAIGESLNSLRSQESGGQDLKQEQGSEWAFKEYLAGRLTQAEAFPVRPAPEARNAMDKPATEWMRSAGSSPEHEINSERRDPEHGSDSEPGSDHNGERLNGYADLKGKSILDVLFPSRRTPTFQDFTNKDLEKCSSKPTHEQEQRDIFGKEPPGKHSSRPRRGSH